VIPRRAVRVMIDIEGDTWADALAELARITDLADRRGLISGRIAGGPNSGSTCTVAMNPGMTNERYVAALTAYLNQPQAPTTEETPR